MNQACWAKSEIVNDAMETKGISLDLETEGMRNKQRITIHTILRYAHLYPKSWSYIYF